MHAGDDNGKIVPETFAVEGSDEEIPLRNMPLCPEAVVRKDGKAIQMQTDINVRTEQARSNMQDKSLDWQLEPRC